MNKSIKKYGFASRTYFIPFFALTFFITGLYLLYFFTINQVTGVQKIVLFGITGFFMLLGIGFSYVYNKIPKYVFFMGENHLEVLDKRTKEKVVYKFSEIGDVYLFVSGNSIFKNNLVFRANSHASWYHVTTYTADLEKFSEDFLENYFKYKTPALLDKAEKGEKLEFKYFDKKSKIKSSFIPNFNKTYKKIKTKSIFIERNFLIYENDKILLKEMEAINDTVLGFLEFKDKNGNTKIRIHEDNFFNLEVFLALYDCILSNCYIENEIEQIKNSRV